MPAFSVLEPAVNPDNRMSFLLDWELTMKCNLDCSYCPVGVYGGHDNSIPHPPLEECLETIDFMFEYVDLYMRQKPKGLKYVILNIYGGESLHHPNIDKILAKVHERGKLYQDRWHLTVTTTTNAIISHKRLTAILPYIDEFTVSYHSENTERQKTQFKQNLLTIKNANRRLKCVVLMSPNLVNFSDGQNIIEWLSVNDIKMLPRQLDAPNRESNYYNEKQITWFNTLYQSKTHGQTDTIDNSTAQNLSSVGRACCGGRQTCQDQNYQERKFYVIDNKFTDWYCSVNHFFVCIKQVTKEIFVNRDCKMNFDGKVGPIGTLSQATEILQNLAHQLDTGTLPIIQCKKDRCFCGLCAPKAKNLDTYKSIIKKYQTT
jgi:pyruvate-formate lyase-activating enzyme